MRPTLPALTGLRFVAALVVVVYHALRPALVEAQGPLARLLANGPAAVTLFFVLSGFVLTWAHDDASASLDRRAFAVARVARLAPAYLLALVLVMPLGAIARARGVVDDALGPLSLVLVATGLQAWVPDAALRWNPPAWSLSCELFFYALFPWLAGALRRAQVPALVLVAVVMWLIGVAGPLAYLALDPDGLGVPRLVDEAPWLHVVKFHPLVRVPEFITGMVAGRLFLRGTRVPTRVGTASVVVMLALLAALPLPPLVWHNGLLAPLFALVIAWLAGTGSTAARALASPALLRLGDASYALYLLHVPVMMWTMALTRSRDLSPSVALLACGLAIPLSLVVERLVERPMRRLIGERLATPPAPT